ncbi:MAG TPA: dTDP-glucose 4,6-dehydratase [Acidimicrobiia bacterium]|nr:dTDP-glucose 4,6-dehydratase [Acidimicrobiia bacterium]
MARRIVVTGGAGFIGGALIDRLLALGDAEVICLDKLTYAGNRFRLADQVARGLTFRQVDLADRKGVHDILMAIQPELVFHLAAESHVDRSIDEPDPFVITNVVGTSNVLAACLDVQSAWGMDNPRGITLVHVSTDEVFGSAAPDELFSERSPYRPRSPYSATKAAADHLVAAWRSTFGLRAIITNCSNNYGPYQFPEKLIPHTIIRALTDKAIPIYGDGQHQRDWIYVDDHVSGLLAAAQQGASGQTYLFGGRAVITNADLVHRLCELLDSTVSGSRSFLDRIVFVPDRPGHDRRYALDPTTTEQELDWRTSIDLETGLRETVNWYLTHEQWWRDLLGAGYTAERLGLKP